MRFLVVALTIFLSGCAEKVKVGDCFEGDL